MTAFTFNMVPLAPKGARYFIRRGASTNYVHGFRSKAAVEDWLDSLNAGGALRWRVGPMFRLHDDDVHMQIVRRDGRPM